MNMGMCNFLIRQNWNLELRCTIRKIVERGVRTIDDLDIEIRNAR